MHRTLKFFGTLAMAISTIASATEARTAITIYDEKDPKWPVKKTSAWFNEILDEDCKECSGPLENITYNQESRKFTATDTYKKGAQNLRCYLFDTYELPPKDPNNKYAFLLEFTHPYGSSKAFNWGDNDRVHFAQLNQSNLNQLKKCKTKDLFNTVYNFGIDDILLKECNVDGIRQNYSSYSFTSYPYERNSFRACTHPDENGQVTMKVPIDVFDHALKNNLDLKVVLYDAKIFDDNGKTSTNYDLSVNRNGRNFKSLALAGSNFNVKVPKVITDAYLVSVTDDTLHSDTAFIYKTEISYFHNYYAYTFDIYTPSEEVTYEVQFFFKRFMGVKKNRT